MYNHHQWKDRIMSRARAEQDEQGRFQIVCSFEGGLCQVCRQLPGPYFQQTVVHPGDTRCNRGHMLGETYSSLTGYPIKQDEQQH